MHSLEHLGVPAHPEVVIGAPDRHAFFRRTSVGTRELLREPVDVVEIPVRLVLVLLLKLGIVETLIVEPTIERCGAVSAWGCSGNGIRRVGPKRRSKIRADCCIDRE